MMRTQIVGTALLCILCSWCQAQVLPEIESFPPEAIVNQQTAFSWAHRVLHIDSPPEDQQSAEETNLGYAPLYVIDADEALRVTKASLDADDDKIWATWSALDEQRAPILFSSLIRRSTEASSAIRCQSHGIVIVATPPAVTGNFLWKVVTLEKLYVEGGNIHISCFASPHVIRRESGAYNDDCVLAVVPREYLLDGKMTVHWKFALLKDYRYYRAVRHCIRTGEVLVLPKDAKLTFELNKG